MITKQLTNYRFILVPVAIGLFLSSLTLPWIIINFLGSASYSPFDIVKALIDRNAGIISSAPQNGFGLLDLTSAYIDSSFAFIASILLYLFSIATMIISVAWKTHRSKIALAAGILAMSAGTAWIYSIESLKTNVIQSAASLGGIVGEEWIGKESSIVNSIIVMGFGHYIVILAGATAIVAYLWRSE